MELQMDVREKFDAILARVKEPQSELSLAELGLIKKMTYYKADKTIMVYMNFAPQSPVSCPACFITTDMMKDSVERDLKEAILEDFPGWTVSFSA